MARRPAPGRLATLVALMLLASTAWAATSEAEGTWRLESPLGEVAGTWLLVRDEAAGAWRFEVGLDDRDPGADLRRRQGRGWTFSGLLDEAFVQPWHGSWWQAGVATAAFLQGLATVAIDPPRRLVLTTWEDLPVAWRPPGREPPPGGLLRRQLVRRGLGRGGDGLVVSVAERNAGVRLTTTRWPVSIEVGLPTRRRGSDLPAEAFLPLWSLADFATSR